MKMVYSLLLIGVLAIAGCSWMPHFGKDNASQQDSAPQKQTLMKSLTGEVDYDLPQPLPAGAYLEVTLSDVSRQDAPARVVAKDRIVPVGASPVTFVLSYEPADLRDGVDFAVSAHIQQGTQLLAFNDTRVSVLGRSGTEGPVRIVLAAAH